MTPFALLRTHALILALIWSAAAAANDFVVTNTDDDGAGSLRQAIADANAICRSGGMHTISFAIPGTGVHTIRPLTPLPALLSWVAIDGYTQPGSQMNTLAEGSNAALRIELDGSLAGDSPGIALAITRFNATDYCSARQSSISGLVINRFSQAGIKLDGCAFNDSNYTLCTMSDVDIRDNYIGTDASGTQALGNGLGIEIGINVKDLTIGTDSPPASAFMSNLISGNHGDGIWIAHVPDINAATGILVRNNYIGLDAGGVHALGNSGHGIRADPAGLLVQQNFIAANGGDGVNLASTNAWYGAGAAGVYANKIGIGIHDEAFGNDGDGVHVDGHMIVSVTGDPANGGFASRVANNGGAGVFVAASADTAGTSWPHVQVRGNSIRDNGGLGIDIAPVGVNPIRTDGDLLGPNENLNAPVLASIAAGVPNGANVPVTVSGSVHTVAQKDVDVYFHANTACDSSGHGEAEASPTQWRAHGTTDANGDFAFTTQFTVSAGSVSAGSFIAASTERFTTTNGFTQDLITSELSNCLRVPAADLIFRNGFDP
ncbi:right-handed parallel beta-helix repeat-containing protein [Dokdonella sp.]|uniref:right-handed parallel beta-helix repeat-containing protein n=1 Tax=Dokdonella sp. TaxID=2291710 RepID=UPI001B295CD7|nr:right-handed parallel beta-helix repeat-containing protein [Dokdonella sp.]MBO9663730.1 right-handed parallel beta-helix repeat-containing protein [Dokdonella sp.]